MLPRVVAWCALVALSVGCGRAPQTAASSEPSTPAVAETANSGDEASATAMLADLTQAVRKFSAEQRRVPKSLDELVAQGYLSQVPPAPAGKAFAINKTLQVYLTPH